MMHSLIQKVFTKLRHGPCAGHLGDVGFLELPSSGGAGHLAGKRGHTNPTSRVPSQPGGSLETATLSLPSPGPDG